jgi:hypothetical protein
MSEFYLFLIIPSALIAPFSLRLCAKKPPLLGATEQGARTATDT